MAFKLQQFLCEREIYDIFQSDGDKVCIIHTNGKVVVLDLESNVIIEELYYHSINQLSIKNHPLGLFNNKLILPQQVIDLDSQLIMISFKDFIITKDCKKLFVKQNVIVKDHILHNFGELSQQDYKVKNLQQFQIRANEIRSTILKKYIATIVNNKYMKLRSGNGKEHLFFNRLLPNFYQICQGFKEDQIIIQMIAKGMILHMIRQKIIRRIRISTFQRIATDGNFIILKEEFMSTKVNILDIIALKKELIFKGSRITNLNISHNHKFVFWKENRIVYSFKLSN